MVSPYMVDPQPNYLGNALAGIGQMQQQRTSNALAERQIGLSEAQARRQEEEFRATQAAAQRARVDAQMKNVATALFRQPENARAQVLAQLQTDPRFSDLPPQAWQFISGNPQMLTNQNLSAFLNAGGELTPDQVFSDKRRETEATTAPKEVVTPGPNGLPTSRFVNVFSEEAQRGIVQAPDANTSLTQRTSRENNAATNATSRANNRDSNATSRENARLQAERTGGAGGMTATQRANVQTKLQAVSLVQAQLRRAREAFKAIENSALQAGPGTQFNPLANGGQRFDAIARGLQQTIRQLTRTPGEGAMSDYESRLASMIVPDRGDLEGVTAARLDELQNLVNDIESGYSGMSMPNTGGATGGWGKAEVEGN